MSAALDKTQQHRPADARRVAVDCLVRIGRDGGYSGVVLDSALERAGDSLGESDRALATRLVYGVTERRLALDYVIGTHSSMKLNRLHPVVLELLRTGCYQLLYMDRIPAAAAIHETVRIARAMKQERATGFINAVLRAIDRGREHVFDALPDTDEGLSVRTSCPVELLSLWRAAYGDDMARTLAYGSLEAPPVTLRANTLRVTPEAFATLLDEAGVAYEDHPWLPACFILKQENIPKKLANWPQSCYYHQDVASQLCCAALKPSPGSRLADVCAAPGGKSLTCAQWMEGRGTVLAADVHAGKCAALKQRAADMGADIVEVIRHDATQPWPDEWHAAFDRVLCDVPCSGLGVIRRKPEIRYKPLDTFKDLPATQLAILEQAATLVRPGGWLQYSTCTLNPAENEAVAARFLDRNPAFEKRVLPLESCFDATGRQPDFQITLFPSVHGSDGFYIAGFTKVG